MKTCLLSEYKKTKYGIIGFADSKASRKFNDGHICEDVDRGHIPKLFNTQNFLLATSGTNELLTKLENIPLEKTIQRLLNKSCYCQNYKVFLDALVKEINEYNDITNGQYHFLVGVYEQQSYWILRYIVQYNKEEGRYILKLLEKSKEFLVYTEGETFYVEAWKNLPSFYDMPFEKQKEVIQRSLEGLVGVYDTFKEYGIYNSVGGPYQIELFSIK